MSVLNLPSEAALQAGADLWVVENNAQSYWWNELDFRAGFLFSKTLNHSKVKLPEVILKLLNDTQLPSFSFTEDENILLLGTESHFHCHWILLWKDSPEKVCQKLIAMESSLKIKNLRFFSSGGALNPLFETRLTASFEQISYVTAP